MVHWAGEGSSVIICLARDPTQKSSGPPVPSAVYISYDYGVSFKNKTENFRLGDAPKDGYAQLDKFYNHPVIVSYVRIVFLYVKYSKFFSFYINLLFSVCSLMSKIKCCTKRVITV